MWGVPFGKCFATKAAISEESTPPDSKHPMGLSLIMRLSTAVMSFSLRVFITAASSVETTEG